MKKRVLVGVIAFTLLVGAGLGIGIQEFLNKPKDIPAEQVNAVYKSLGFTEKVAQDLTRHKRELELTDDPTARAELIQHIQDEFGDYKINNVKHANLKQFMDDIACGNIE